MADEDVHEDTGFDEAPTIGAEDLVTLEQADGTRIACVLLAVLEHGDQTYAVLTPRDGAEDGDGDLLVVSYREDEDGTAHLSPVDDAEVLVALEEQVGRLVGWDDDGTLSPHVGGPVAEA